MTGVRQVSIAIIGGGLAGLATAVQLYRRGITDIVILEREKKSEGILRQCIHDGFGLTQFRETLSGLEYAQRSMDMVDDIGIPYITDTIILEITPDKRIYISSREGMIRLQAKAVILTAGYRKRTRGAASIPGERPAGVYTAGVAQAYISLRSKMVGRGVAILGSGDIGMIMARHLTPEGTHVRAVFKTQPYPGGLPRNIEQCLRDYDIPLYLSHTVTDTSGKERLGGVVVSQVGNHMQPVPGSEKTCACDTLILSVELISESGLSPGADIILDGRSKGAVVDENYQTSVDGIFAAGNMPRVHDLVDFVPRETERLGDAAAKYVREGGLPSYELDVRTDECIIHVISQKISGNESFYLSLRAERSTSDYRIWVLQGGCVIKKQIFEKASPVEMIQITVDVSVLDCREDVEAKVA